MINAILTGLSVLAANLIIAALAVRYVRHIREEMEATISSWMSPQGDKPSQMLEMLDTVGETFSKKLVTSIKASFMGMQSVDSRNNQRLEADMMQDLAGQASPLLGILLEKFPAVGRRLAKNPELIPMAQGLLEKYAGKLTGAVSNNGHTQSSSSGTTDMNNFGGN